jgi:hypothetical protein
MIPTYVIFSLRTLLDNPVIISPDYATSKAEQEISVKKCSLPEQKLKQVFDTLGIKQRPFAKIKSVVHKQKLRKPDSLVCARFPSG